MSHLRLFLLVVIAALLPLVPSWAERGQALLTGSGENVVLAYENSVYNEHLEKLGTIPDRAITAIAAIDERLYIASRRNLYSATLSAADVRLLLTLKSGTVRALSAQGDSLYAAVDDNVYRIALDGSASVALHGKAPGGIRALYAAPDGVYAASGRTLWRIRDGRRDKIAVARSEILALAGGRRNVYVACRVRNGVQIEVPGSPNMWTIAGLKEVDGMYLNAAGNTIYYSWTDRDGPHVLDLALVVPPH